MAEHKKTGRRCNVCKHPMRADINRLLVMSNMSVPKIAEKYDLHMDSLRRHRDNPTHLTESMKREILVEAKRDREQVVADELNDERIDVGSTYDSLARRVDRLIKRAEDDENDGLALSAMEGMRKVLRDIATMQGRLAQNLTVTVSLAESPEWCELQSMLEAVFEQHPAAGKLFLTLARRKRLSIASHA